ncbi:hypothetical protein [Clostridium niameyense]|uniref:hypothetical protein n=1 Tax=Clostridium niameyense TaxID=1622073 RepID=UPI00067ED0A5|nr:hypothetical protein [Clostridium niameyense]
MDNIFETVVKGSNIVFLNVPYEEYFANYHKLDGKSAEYIIENYFKNKGKNCSAKILDIECDDEINKIKIATEVKQKNISDNKKHYNSFN